MPNWCSNHIQISGPECPKLIADIKSLPPEAEFMSSLVPHEGHPEMERILADKDFLLYPYSTFYGTKWDFRVEEVLGQGTFNEDSLYFTIDTAWSPPTAFLEKLAQKYDVHIAIDYSEGGCNFCGQAIIDSDGVNDVCYTYLEGKYILDEEEFWMEVSSTVDNLECTLNESELLQNWDNLKADVEKEFDFVLPGDLTELIAMYKEAHDNYLKEQQNEKVDNNI